MEFGWIVGWVSWWVQSFHFAMGWVGLSHSFGGLGWVEGTGPTDNAELLVHFNYGRLYPV